MPNASSTRRSPRPLAHAAGTLATALLTAATLAACQPTANRPTTPTITYATGRRSFGRSAAIRS